jgi:hydroxymethylpyrimidine pyrophosphatase-like HAD family hydrolase
VIFTALACDYDGTLASQDRIGAEALAALLQAREAGLRLVLVTGRTFFELTRVCERLDLFEAVVAENGGVLYFPGAGMIRDQGPPPPPRLLAALDRRGIPFQVGRVIVGAARRDEQGVRDALAATGISRELCYNRAALMLLPAGISKGAGVRQVIRALGLSFHDVLALGDAENDLDLFEACGWAGCPASAVPALQDRADWIFPGDDGAAVARAIAGPILRAGLAVDRSPRHRVALGWAVETSEVVTIPVRGVNVLIYGDPLSGKSWLAGALVERLVDRRYAVCILDPEGDYRVLARLPNVLWVEVRDRASMERALGHFDLDPSVSIVADLAALPHREKVEIIETALTVIRRSRRRLGLPHWVVLDEAHYSLHPEGVAEHASGVEDRGFCLATYRARWLRESVMKAMDVLLLARITRPEELAFLRRVLADSPGGGEDAISDLPDLPRGKFLMMQPEATGPRTALTFVAPPRDTPHVRHLKKYVDSSVSPEWCFFFRRSDGSRVATADNLSTFREALWTVEDNVLAYHAQRGDFSRWVRDVITDLDLAAQLRKSEARWNRGEITDLRRTIEELITVRYGEER